MMMFASWFLGCTRKPTSHPCDYLQKEFSISFRYLLKVVSPVDITQQAGCRFDVSLDTLLV
jgi:hypothetical protein